MELKKGAVADSEMKGSDESMAAVAEPFPLADSP